MIRNRHTIEIDELIEKYSKKKNIQTHIMLTDYFDRIFIENKPEEFSFTQFKGFLHHLRWHNVNNIFKRANKLFKPLNRLQFLCNHLDIPIYEFLKIYGFFNCNHPDFDLTKSYRKTQNKTNLNKFLKSKSSGKEIYGFICDSLSNEDNWIGKFNDIEFDYGTIAFSTSKIKKPGTGIPGNNLDKAMSIMWAICIYYKIPFFQLLEHLDVLSKADYK